MKQSLALVMLMASSASAANDVDHEALKATAEVCILHRMLAFALFALLSASPLSLWCSVSSSVLLIRWLYSPCRFLHFALGWYRQIKNNYRKILPSIDPSKKRQRLIFSTPLRIPAITRPTQPRIAPFSPSAYSTFSLYARPVMTFATTANPAETTSTRTITSTGFISSTTVYFVIRKAGEVAHRAHQEGTASLRSDASWKRLTTRAKSGFNHSKRTVTEIEWFSERSCQRLNRECCDCSRSKV